MAVEDPTRLAGTERSVVLAARGLGAAGHQVYLLHTGEGTAGPEVDGQIALPELFDTGPFFERGAVRAAMAELLDFVSEKKIHVIHLHTVLRFAVWRRLVARIPLVSTAHVVLCPNGARYLWNERKACDRKIGIGCLTTGYTTKGCGHLGNSEPIGVPGFLRAMVRDRRTRTGMARSHRVIAPSHWMGSYLEANGIAPTRVRVVEPPVAAPPRGLVEASNGVPLVTFVGRLVDFKGADQLIRSSALLDFDHRVVIVGKGPVEEQLRRLASDLGVGGRVDLVGELPPREVDALRLRSGVVVVPSLWPEPFGMVGVEALALGIPVVGYRVGGASEWLTLGQPLAAAVEPGDVEGMAREIQRMVLHPPSPDERRSARSRVRERLSLARHCDQLLHVYKEAICEFSAHRAS